MFHKNLTKNKLIVIFVYLFINQSILSEGFLAGTLVQVPQGYKSIEQLQENDLVISYSFKDKSLISGKISHVKKTNYKTCIKITIAGKDIITAPDHKFYCPISEKSQWIKAEDLRAGDFILCNLTECKRIDSIEELNQENDFYCLSIDKYQNFFVSDNKIFVHNFAQLSFILLQGSMVVVPKLAAIAAPAFIQTLKVATPAIIYGFYELGKFLFAGSSAKACPEEIPVKIINKPLAKVAVAATAVNGINILYKKMTNKEAREEAKKLKDRGLGEWDPDPSVKNQKNRFLPVFKKKDENDWISPDVDGHGRSIWKRLDRNGERIASLDENLKIIRK